MTHEYARYQDIDQTQLQIDIDAIKEQIGAPNEEDFKHLLKLEKWGTALSVIGYALVALVSYIEMSDYGISSLAFWIMAILAAVAIGIGNVSRWANVAHPILHGAYDKVPNVPHKYTKSGFAQGNRRFIDWLDWIKPEAWMYEHNIMHHYHLGEQDDPDNVEANMEWLTKSSIPMPIRYIAIFILAASWKFTYYAPNTLNILENKNRRKAKLEESDSYEFSPFSKNGFELWKSYYLPYGLFRFVIIPLLFFPLGTEAIFNAFIIMLMAEAVANLHSFTVIVPNHSADDIYQFEKPHKSQGEFYLRQIMGSVNYATGSDLLDFGHGWLNYQVEHHLFPNLPLSQYQKMQPVVKELCAKYNLEYRQESVFIRVWKTVELMVGKTKVLRIEGI